VLVVDDEPLIRWSLRTGLTRRGHLTVEASDAAEARAALIQERGQFLVAFLDYRLPDCQDLSLLMDVKRLAPACAVFLMTAYAEDGMRARAVSEGAAGVIDKPFDVSRLVQLVDDAAGRS
jgi:two-component system NtrC family response regulator